MLPLASVLFWVTSADTRAYKQDEWFIVRNHHLFHSGQRIVLGVNKIDVLYAKFNERGNRAENVVNLVSEKISDVFSIIRPALPAGVIFAEDDIVPYSSLTGHGISDLFHQLTKEL